MTSPDLIEEQSSAFGSPTPHVESRRSRGSDTSLSAVHVRSSRRLLEASPLMDEAACFSHGGTGAQICHDKGVAVVAARREQP